MSDDEYSDEYDGFSFGDDFDEVRSHSRNIQSILQIKRFHQQDRRVAKRAEQQLSPEETATKKLYDVLSYGKLEELVELLENNSTIKIDDSLQGSYTPLMLAARSGKFEMVEYLVKERKANVLFNPNNTSALMVACNAVNDDDATKVVKVLIESGARVNDRDTVGQSPLMKAASSGLVQVVDILLEHSADLNACDNLIRTAIFFAVENNHKNVVQKLKDSGAYLTLKNIQGQTVRQLAELAGFDEIIDLLPEDEQPWLAPHHYVSYSTFRDYLPTVFRDEKR